MGLFNKLFGSKKLITTDSDFGKIESFSTNGTRIGWLVNRKYLNTEIEILIEGTKDGIDESEKQILLQALNNEAEIKSESEKALKEQFENAEMEFIALEKHFELKGISVRNGGLEMAFLEKKKRYFFNVQFENNKQVGVSISG